MQSIQQIDLNLWFLFKLKPANLDRFEPGPATQYPGLDDDTDTRYSKIVNSLIYESNQIALYDLRAIATLTVFACI
jgi:hypothetical protein